MAESHNSKLSKTLLYLSLIFIFLGCLTTIINFDLWWHLTGGRYNLLHGVILDKDVFSYTFNGYEWLNFEWLFELFYYLFYRFGGVSFTIITKAVVVTVSYLILFKTITLGKQKTGGLLVYAVVIFFYLGARPRFLVRPQIFMYFFLISYYYILLQYREHSRNYLYLLPALQIPWSGLHSSPFYGQMLVGFFLGERVVAYLLDQRRDKQALVQIKKLTFYLAVLLLILLANPYHYLIYVFPVRAMKVIHEIDVIGEWLPPTFSQSFPFHHLGLILFVAIIYPLLKKRRFAEIAFLAFLAISSLRYIRLIGIFLFILTPISVRVILEQEWSKCKGFLRKRPLVKLASLAGIVVVMLTLSYYSITYSFIRPGLTLAPGRYPVQAIEFIKSNLPKKRGLTTYNWGGFFSWNLYPDQEIFIDGRGMPFLNVFKEYYYLFRSPEDFHNILEKYQIEYVFWDFLYPEAGARNQEFFEPSRWQLVYFDSMGAIYLRKSRENAALISEFGYQYLQPFAPGNSYLRPQNAQARAEMDREIAQAIATDPKNITPYLMRAYLATIANELEDAIAAYKNALAINDNHDVAHFNLAQLYRHLNRKDEAQVEYRKTIQINDQYTKAYVYLGLLLAEKREYQAAERQLRQAVRIAKDNALANFCLSLLLERQQDPDAQSYRQKAQSLMPGLSRSQQNEIKNIAARFGKSR